MDAVDQRIIALLVADARASYAEIGAKVSLSAPAVKRRVDRLRSSGVIKGFTTVVDPAAVGWTTEAFVELFCTGRTTPAQITVATRRHPEVVGAYTVSGEADALVHLRAADIGHLEQALERLRAEPFVTSTRSMIVLSRLVETRLRCPRRTAVNPRRRAVRPACHVACCSAQPSPPRSRLPAARPTPRTRRPAAAHLRARPPAAGRLRLLRPAHRRTPGRREGRGRPVGLPERSHASRWKATAGSAEARRTRPPARRPAAARAAAPGYSGTNAHEQGVDEPDIVKTDGRRIVTVDQGVLRVVDAATREPTGKLALGVEPVGQADLLLSGDRALVLVNRATPAGMRSA